MCPFCGGDVSRAEPRAVRPVSRRAFTRAAIMVGAAVLAGCRAEETHDEVADDETSGGDGDHDFSSDRDTGEGRDTHVRDDTRDADEERRREDERLAEEQRRLEEEQRRLEEDQYDPRRHRQLPACVSEGTCPAPPYGAPPTRDELV
jgi:hypothetical protein